MADSSRGEKVFVIQKEDEIDLGAPIPSPSCPEQGGDRQEEVGSPVAPNEESCLLAAVKRREVFAKGRMDTGVGASV